VRKSLPAGRPTPLPAARADTPANGHAQGRTFRIVAADNDSAVCQMYREALPALGYETLVVGCNRQVGHLCRSATCAGRPPVQVGHLCRTICPDLLVAGDELLDLAPGSMFPVPVLLVSNRSNPDILSSLPNSPIVGFLGKPILLSTLGPAVAGALRSAFPELNLQYRYRHGWQRYTATAADVWRHVDSGWPKCCGDSMTLGWGPVPQGQQIPEQLPTCKRCGSPVPGRQPGVDNG
jgi:hypothetical protein